MKSKLTGEGLFEKFSIAASSNTGRIHVVESSDGWSVKKEGAVRSYSVKKNKQEAFAVADKLKVMEVIVLHEVDGTITEVKPIYEADIVRQVAHHYNHNVTFGRPRRKRLYPHKGHKLVKGVKVLRRG